MAAGRIFLYYSTAANDQLEMVSVRISVAPQGSSIQARIMVASPTHALNGTAQPKRPKCGAPLSRLGCSCYFNLGERILYLSLSTKAGAMLRPLLVSIVMHHSSLWVIFWITAVICYVLSSFMMLCPNFVLTFCIKSVYHFLFADHPSAHLRNREAAG